MVSRFAGFQGFEVSRIGVSEFRGFAFRIRGFAFTFRGYVVRRISRFGVYWLAYFDGSGFRVLCFRYTVSRFQGFAVFEVQGVADRGFAV